MPRRLIPLVVLFATSTVLHAQPEHPVRYQLYGGYTYLSNTFNGIPGSRQSLNGWDASIAFPAWHEVRFKVDSFAYRGTSLGAQQDAFFVMGGAQYSRRLGRESFFVEGLAGDGGLNRYWGPSQSPGETASFSSVLGGGIDTPLARHFAFRVDGGYQHSNFVLINNVQQILPVQTPGLPKNFGRISSGIVWGF